MPVHGAGVPFKQWTHVALKFSYLFSSYTIIQAGKPNTASVAAVRAKVVSIAGGLNCDAVKHTKSGQSHRSPNP